MPPIKPSCHDEVVGDNYYVQLFNDVVNWELIETYLPNMVRVVLSIKAGKITASTILWKLGSYSRKNNKLYQAFQELGRAIFTVRKSYGFRPMPALISCATGQV